MAAVAAFEALEKVALNNASNQGWILSFFFSTFNIYHFHILEKFYNDLFNIARTTLSSKILQQEKDHFSRLCVEAVKRLKGSTNLDSIAVIKKTGAPLRDSYLEEGFILEKKIGVGQPKRLENPKILLANTAMDTDKIKIFGSRIRVDSEAKLAELEEAEKVILFFFFSNALDQFN